MINMFRRDDRTGNSASGIRQIDQEGIGGIVSVNCLRAFIHLVRHRVMNVSESR
jgi:hypothetical protein